ncbi:MAG: ATP-binding cassette domain-containing protein [Gammaproteobacteria bacterium]|nr:ATP-binding cassette domain-containing protein [Gammaproteobacteria bacterium]
MPNSSRPLIEVKSISKSFTRPDGQPLAVLDNVSFTMNESEIVALLGKSGSGKSTLLRIIAGLTPPSTGDVFYRDQAVRAPVPGISMVFQSFALMPWLTVLENVELGLEALGYSAKERRIRALHAIDIIGMGGFESAYPKELSGGMRQRVGVARALVVKPDLLLMDEPFSALDVLTAETLRNDVLELWQEESHMKGILFVTHNIEEAVMVADRILVFGNNPGYISGELEVNLPHPRNSQDKAVLDLIDEVYRMMTSAQSASAHARAERITVDLGFRLPDAQVAELIGLLEEVEELQQKGPVDLPELADSVRLDINDLFPVLESLSVLGLAKVSEGDISMTAKGKALIAADITDKKVLFANMLTESIPLAKHILDTLHQRPDGRASEELFLATLEDYFTEEEAERVLTTMIDWGRYAELFSYDYNTGILSLDDEENER